MYAEEIEKLIKFALVDGDVSEKERDILVRKAIEAGIDRDEFEMVLDARIYEAKQQNSESAIKESSESDNNGSKSRIKCPNCQATIDSFSTSCEYCDYDVIGRDPNASIKHLFDLLTQAEAQRREEPKTIFSTMQRAIADSLNNGLDKTDRKKMEIIATFPIPNTKADILEFLSLAFPKAQTIGNFFTKHIDQNRVHNQFAKVWRNKCKQIIMKAKFSMKDDPETLEEVLYYARELGIH
jgi:hypothetical protein